LEELLKIREEIEACEVKFLSPKAAFSSATRGRVHPEPECDIRTAFQRDRDRIIHSKSFRRLKHKTQVFLAPTGDHYRTRLTHTLEVSQIARTIARSLRLNEDLTEAIALGHDLGHTPFGHTGEAVLNSLVPGGFRHYEQSLRVVDTLEKDGKGLNLTFEVRDGILKHSIGEGEIIPVKKEERAETLEGRVVRVSDIVAYVNHDIDDAIRAGVLKAGDIPRVILKVLGETHSRRINTMVSDIIRETKRVSLEGIKMSGDVYAALIALRDFLYARVYENDYAKGELEKSEKVISDLYNYFLKHPDKIPLKNKPKTDEPLYRRVSDYIAGMTDRYAIMAYEEIFIPKPWAKF
jgi:dGTPase